MKQHFVLFLISSLLLASCAGITNVTVTPSVSLSSGNFSYIRDVEGETTYTYVFGIGGMNEKNASDLLVKNANLKPGEALANVSVLTKRKVYFLGLVVIKVIQAHAQVVGFIDSPLGIRQDIKPGSNLRATPDDDNVVRHSQMVESINSTEVYPKKVKNLLSMEEEIWMRVSASKKKLAEYEEGSRNYKIQSMEVKSYESNLKRIQDNLRKMGVTPKYVD